MENIYVDLIDGLKVGKGSGGFPAFCQKKWFNLVAFLTTDLRFHGTIFIKNSSDMLVK